MIIFPVLLVLSCAQEAEELREDCPGAGLWSVECSGFDESGGENSKSRFSDDGLAVRNFNVWVYDGAGNLANTAENGCETYFEGSAAVDGSRIFPNAFADYDVYVIANTGEIPVTDVPARKELAEEFRLKLDYGRFAEDGLPLAAHRRLCPAFSDCILKVVPLVARYDIRIVNASDTDYSFRLKSVVACNCASAVSPFLGESGAWSEADVTSVGDCFVTGTDDFDARQGTLYLLENVQGTVFSNPSSRIPSSMLSGKADCASYLQFEGSSRHKDDTGYDKVTCRYYFGEGREAFVQRNVRTLLTLRLTKGIYGNDEWTVEKEDWFNQGRVVFYPSSVTVTSGKTAIVNVKTFGASGDENPYVKYRLSYDGALFSKAQLRMEWMPSGSSVWRAYSADVVEGPCSIRIGTSFLGLGTASAGVDAIGTDGTLLSPVPLSIKVEGYAYPVSIQLVTTDFTNMSADGALEFRVIYSDGSSKKLSGHYTGLSLQKLTGSAKLSDPGSGWKYHLSDEYVDCCTFKAVYVENVGGTEISVSANCSFSVWALDSESSLTRYNTFQDSGKSMTTSDYKNYYVSSRKISTSGTVFRMDGGALCLTNGKSTKVVSVNPQTCSWTVTLAGQTVADVFSVFGNNAIQIKRTGSIVGSNASFAVRMNSGYKDTEGHTTDLQSFSITITE